MSIQVIIVLVGLFSTMFGSITTYAYSRRKNRAETLGIELDNANKVIAIWRELSEEQAKKVDELEIKVGELQTELKALVRLYEAQCNNCSYKKYYNDNNKQ